MQQGGNTEKSPYLFTAKELDEETGLYYYGARYYDPRASVWQSADPILAKYLPSGNKEQDEKLPGIGGIFNSANIGLYSYVQNNPLKFVDPDGMQTAVVINGTTSGNPFGHVAIATTGSGVYSYGNKTELGSSLTAYLEREAPRRNTTVIIIETTPEQEKAINAYLEKTSDDLPPWFLGLIPDPTDSCATRTADALEAGGLVDPYTIGPSFPTDVTAQAEFWKQALGGESVSIPKDSPSIPKKLESFDP